MEFLAYLAPIAFVFAIAALAKVSTLEKKVEELQQEIKKVK